LDKNIDYVTILVYGSPQVLSLTLDRHEQFIQVPGVAQVPLASPERPGVFDPKLPTPLSDGFVADGDAPLRQKIFHISKAQAESVVEPNSMADNIMVEIGSRDNWAPPTSYLSLDRLDNFRIAVCNRVRLR
jgi:hypothetical protein